MDASAMATVPADRTGVPMPTSPRSSFTRHNLLVAAALLAASAGAVQTSQAANLPPHFDANANASIGQGFQCVAGNATDADGMNARAWVTVEDANTHKVRWA